MFNFRHNLMFYTYDNVDKGFLQYIIFFLIQFNFYLIYVPLDY